MDDEGQNPKYSPVKYSMKTLEGTVSVNTSDLFTINVYSDLNTQYSRWPICAEGYKESVC